MTDDKNRDDELVNFTYPEGMRDAADYCVKTLAQAGSSHFSISGINVDLEAGADMTPTLMTLIKNVYWQ